MMRCSTQRGEVLRLGFASAGCNVTYYGCVPTGVYALNLERNGLDGGILITGSHMPPDRIGIIACLGDGSCTPIDITDQVNKGEENTIRYEGYLGGEPYTTGGARIELNSWAVVYK